MSHKEITLRDKIMEMMYELDEFDKEEIKKALAKSEFQNENLQGYEKAYLTGWDNALNCIYNLLVDFNLNPELI